MKNPFERFSFNRTKNGRFTPATTRPPMESVATKLLPKNSEVREAAWLPTASEVREWARSQGIDVGERGRVSQALYQQYRSAHKGDA